MNKPSFLFGQFSVTTFIILLLTGTLHAQYFRQLEYKIRIPDANTVQILTTHDGATLIGRIVEIDESDIQFETGMGRLVIPIARIKNIEITSANSIKDGSYWFPNPNRTRLFFAPTGRMLKQGQGYFADYYLFFPSLAYGITDNISVGGGLSLIPGVDFDEQIFYFTPKIGLKAVNNLNFAAGALIISLPNFDDNDRPVVGVVYGVGTFGSMNHNLTVGLGYGFEDRNLADKPLVMLGGELRISRRTAFVTENWILPGVDNPLVSYGIRFFGTKSSVDLALINTIGEEAIYPGIPYIDFVFNF